MRSIKSVGLTVAAFALLAFVASPLVRAADEKAKGIEGTWKWTQAGGRGGRGGGGGGGAGGGGGGAGGGGGQARGGAGQEYTAHFDAPKEGKFTGHVMVPQGRGRRGGGGGGAGGGGAGGADQPAPQPTKVDITNGKIEGNTVSFTLKREVNRQGDTMTITSNYKGTLEGDTIKGTVETEVSGGQGGNAQPRDWEAHRATDGDKKEESK